MKLEIVTKYTSEFEKCVQKIKEGLEFWFARDLQKLLGYSKWQNFEFVIEKAKLACTTSQEDCQYHFTDISKMVDIGSGAKKEMVDVALTRYACYLIAQNGDPEKPEIAFAQSYFAIQTRNAELIQERVLEINRVKARKKLSANEKELSSLIFQQTGKKDNFALIRSKGDTAFFGGKNTGEMKILWGIKNKPLADFMPTVLLSAKNLATEITNYNVRDKNMKTENQISGEHVTNNKSVRNTLIDRGITPEKVKPIEDVKKVERKITAKKNLDKLTKKSKKK